MNDVNNAVTNSIVGGGSMSSFINGLSTSIESSALWNVLTPVATIVGVMILFALGVRFLRRSIKGAQNGKAKI